MGINYVLLISVFGDLIWWQGGEARNVDCKESDGVITMPRKNKQSMGAETKFLRHLQGSAQELRY
jgi:hypothetical protein